MRLSELKSGESAVIVKVMGHGGFRRRILEMGFVRGQRVEVLLNAPLKDPIEYRIMGYNVSLRRTEAKLVEVMTPEEAKELLKGDQAEGITECESIDEVVRQSEKHIHVALIGNPNSGKTSLFNAISGSREHVGNYSGVTVDAKVGYCKYRGYHFEITDLPGTYALAAYSPEEVYVREHLFNKTPDVIINSIVASNIERNLYLTTELIDINQRMVAALNMYDELEHSGAKLDYETLGAMMGVPMVPVVAKSGRGLDQLLDTVIAVYENQDTRVRHIHINQDQDVELSIKRVSSLLKSNIDELPRQFPPRYFAMKLLEGDEYAIKQLKTCQHFEEWIRLAESESKRIEQSLSEDVETAITNRKYGFISGALKETYTQGKETQSKLSNSIDTLVTHRIWGFPIFLLLMWLMFYCTFMLGGYPQEWIDSGVGWLSSIIERVMPSGVLKDLVIDGIIGGVGSVIIFLPNIIILYLFISFMEDSGYLARAAFIMDKLMHRMGLHGKSFIPLVMGFGCNVPAVMATRTIESFSSRLITVMIIPFMSCSARLPIYILLAATFFPSHAGLVMLSLYVLGMLLALFTSRCIMRQFIFKVDETPFVMELPPYRIPTLKSTLIHMWEKCAQYLKKMGGMILVASILIWALSYYPTSKNQTETKAEHYENSYLGQIGKLSEPIVQPLGLNWKSSVALLSGVAAKEIVVSTIGVLYPDKDVADNHHFGEEVNADTDHNLPERLRLSGDFTPASAMAFLVFILIYFPCIATIVAIGREIGWRWATVSVIYNTLLAWIVSYATYHLMGLFM